MSGVEVVGVVLGAVPLLISGLEHYGDGIRTIKNMWDYEAVVEHLVIEFRLAHGIFWHSCQELLTPVLPDSQSNTLLEGHPPMWADPELDEQLRKRLGTDYNTYTRAVRNLNRQIKLFSRKLGLDEKTFLPPWIANSTTVDRSLRDKFFRNTWKRVKGGFDTPSIRNLLADIQSSINQLNNFTKGSIAVAPKRAALQQRGNSKYWLRIRENAKKLFQSFDSMWACGCPFLHRASLRLDVCHSDYGRRDEEMNFGVLFSFDVPAEGDSSTPLPWNWRDLQARPSMIPQVQKKYLAERLPPGTKKVSFSVETPPKQSKPESLNPACPQSTDPTQIKDLCEALSRLPQDTCCIGYVGESAHRHDLYTTGQTLNEEEARQIICFYDVLRQRGARGLGVKDKYKLALTVASAVLQLHATPWLREKWCLDDIHFLCRKGDAQMSTKTYVSRSFASPGASPRPEIISETEARACVPNEAIFALGVALIEISFGVPILELKNTTDPDLPGYTEFMIATRLVNQNVVKDRDHDKYADVVLRCVKCQLSTLRTPLSLEEASVQQCFYEDIILPLQELNDTLHGPGITNVV